MEAKASWERRRPERVGKRLGEPRVLGIQGQEDGAQA